MKPILFNIWGLDVYAYGFFIAIAFLVTIYLIKINISKFNINISSDFIIDLGVIVLISGIIGARFGYVFINWDRFSRNLIDIFKVNQGGLIFSTGFLLAFIVSYIYIKTKKLNFLNIADYIMPYVALGHAIGRIGCFLNGCCYGKTTTSWIGVKFPNLPDKVLPTQLFESIFLFFLFVLLNIIKDKRKFKGEILLIYISAYSVFRFFMDFIRADTIKFLGFLSLFQVITSVVFVVSLGSIIYFLNVTR